MVPKDLPSTGQYDLFRKRTEDIVHENHPLVILAKLIDWKSFSKSFGDKFHPSNGRPGLPTRLMVGLHYIKHTYNLSDEAVLLGFVENPQWQYFCGSEYYVSDPPCDRSSMTYWRRRIGEEKMGLLLKETIEVAKRCGFAKKGEFQEIVVDTTVQEKNIEFQGAMEFGPRALGCRSILGDARLPGMQKKMNQKIKFRESFRPFAISILEERVNDCFKNVYSPYMLLVSHILPAQRTNELKIKNVKGLKKQKILKSSLPSITHVDYSCRIQTVGENAPKRFRKLLETFYKETACPCFINTSFNVRGEPIVCSPYEAYRCFMNTDMDLCVINDCVLRKEEQKTKFKDLYIEDLEAD